MPKNDPRSEFEGGGLLPSTVFPKGPDALTPADKLRLQSLTGQEEDPKAPIDIYHWQGGIDPDLEKLSDIFPEEEMLRDDGRY